MNAVASDVIGKCPGLGCGKRRRLLSSPAEHGKPVCRDCREAWLNRKLVHGVCGLCKKDRMVKAQAPECKPVCRYCKATLDRVAGPLMRAFAGLSAGLKDLKAKGLGFGRENTGEV